MTFIRPTLAALAVATAFPLAGHAADGDQPLVVVTASRQAQRADEALADVTVIDRARIEQSGASFSLPELLSRQPGIQIASNGGPGKSTSVFMRGGNGNHTILLVDGMRVGSATTGTAKGGNTAATTCAGRRTAPAETGRGAQADDPGAQAGQAQAETPAAKAGGEEDRAAQGETLRGPAERCSTDQCTG